ncbi:MAG: polysaccharide pyruvyl transferase CsaB [bacterium]
MKILISGYYGYENIGDEAVLQAIIQQFAGHKITVLSAAPGLTQEFHKVKAVYRYAPFTVLKEVLSTNLFVSGGGTLFQNITSQRSLFYYLGLILLAKLCRKRVLVLGQGFGPLDNFWPRQITRLILNLADKITVRDKNSYQAMQELGIKSDKIELTADPAALLEIPSFEESNQLLEKEGIKRTGKPLLGIVLRRPIKGLEENMVEMIADAVDWLIDKYNYQPVFLLFRHPNDMEITNKVMRMMNHESSIIFRSCQPREMLGIISQMDLLIGMRLHALIFATMNAVPALGLSYDPKVSSFMESTEQAHVDIKDIDSLKSLKNKLEEILVNKDRIKADLDKKRKQLREASLRNFIMRHARAVPAGRQEGGHPVVDLAGIQVDNISMSEAISKIETFLTSGKPNLIVTPNPEIIVACQHDQELKEIMNSADLRTPDGISMVVVSKIKHQPLIERVSGIDLMLEIIRRFPDKKVFLLGGKPDVAATAAKNLKGNVVGTHDGYFTDDTTMMNKIKETKPDILFIGLGGRRQEKWAAKHLRELYVPIVMCIGGSLDVLSGQKKRAPRIFQRLYLEWLYRLLSEPKRWKRQLALPKFLYLTLIK